MVQDQNHDFEEENLTIIYIKFKFTHMLQRHTENSFISHFSKSMEFRKYCRKTAFLQGYSVKREVFVKPPT